MTIQKGIILAGGSGSRLYPLTLSSNKHLLPIYDKPVIYYPLTTLMLAGIREVLIISSPRDLPALEVFLGTGEQFGMQFHYQIQENPNGLPEAFILGKRFINQQPVAMILGDNIFHGHGLSEAVLNPSQSLRGAHIFLYPVEDPQRFGIARLDQEGKLLELEEKPSNPQSNLAVTGLYYFDGSVSERAARLKPSSRGELEILDLVRSYLEDRQVSVTQLGRGYGWFDSGTPKSLLDASQYVEVIQSRQGSFIASPEEVAWRMNRIDRSQFARLVASMPVSKYRDNLSKLLGS
jgi:glucose-1-phosphate thymidylyltransferase